MLHLVGLTFIYYSKMHGHSNIKFIIIVVLAKHEIAPWWWFLREPKHVGAIVGILIVFNIPMIL